MTEEDAIEHRYRFFTESAVKVSVEHSKLFVALFSAVIGGLIYLVLDRRVGFWPGTLFLCAAFSALCGIASSLIHLNYTARLLFLHAALHASEADTPNVLEPTKPTPQELVGCKAMCQNMFYLQMLQMLGAVLFSVIGFVVLLWDQVQIPGVVLAVSVVLLLVLAWVLGAAVRWSVARRSASGTSRDRRECDGNLGA